MAVESKRGCGYRKIGGIYLVAGKEMVSCDRLPIVLEVCPTCGGGIKQSRGWTWVQPTKLFKGDHKDCYCRKTCRVCNPSIHFKQDDKEAGLIWIGEKHYKTAEKFRQEIVLMGISRRITAIPRNFVLGRTFILLAHPKAGRKEVGFLKRTKGRLSQITIGVKRVPGIFTGFIPERIEKIVKQSDYDLYYNMHKTKKPVIESKLKVLEQMRRDIERGITLIPVPDTDKDHA